jgi:hypothetical protein
MPRIKLETDSRDYQGATREAIPAADDEGFVKEAIEVIDGPRAMDEADALAFYEEQVEIVVHNSGDVKHQENPVEVSVNGRRCFIWRGQRTLCKRKYVERLLLAQSDSVVQDITAREPKDFNRLEITPTQRYPLSVMRDNNPEGAAWLEKFSRAA